MPPIEYWFFNDWYKIEREDIATLLRDGGGIEHIRETDDLGKHIQEFWETVNALLLAGF